jgi:hypothetical protein
MLTVEEQIKLIADAAMDALDLDTAAERRATPCEKDPLTEKVVTMIDVKTTDPTATPQKRPMRVVVAGILAAAAAVVAIVFVASSEVDVVKPADEPSPTVTVPSTTPPRALLSNSSGEEKPLAPGTYFVDEVDGAPTPRIFFTIGAGWAASCDGCIFQGDSGLVSFSRPDRVFSDGCHWSDGYYPGPVTTLDGFVAALSEQRGWADVTTPSDISVDGYAGKAFQRTVPAEITDCDTIPGLSHPPDPLGDHAFRSWESGGFYDPGEVVTLLVLDIDGTVVVIQAELFPSLLFPSEPPGGEAVRRTSAAARADFAAVLDSIRIDRG